MRYRKKLIGVGAVVVLLTIIQFVLPSGSKVSRWYDHFIFQPFQYVRNAVFSLFPFSMGDALYVIGFILFFFTIGRWIFFLVRYSTHKHKLIASFLHTLIIMGVFYVVFLLGWAGNYYKNSLSAYWNLEVNPAGNQSKLLYEYDSFLVQRLNEYADGYRPVSFRELDHRAQQYYDEETDTRKRMQGKQVKPSLFGFLMQNFAIQGYYNPFTGEAQVNKYLPGFMLPFIVCHEMAHQSGIAAEDDANLLAYAVSTATGDSLFRYSAYFNLWLYTHSKLRHQDSVSAIHLLSQLNPFSQSHLDTLRSIRKKYQSEWSDYGSIFYDSFLKFFNQKEGIESYYKVAATAWELEQMRGRGKWGVVRIP